MWIVCITSVRHVLTVNGYGGRQTKENEKSWCFKGWETLVKNNYKRQSPLITLQIRKTLSFYILFTLQKLTSTISIDIQRLFSLNSYKASNLD